MLFQEEPVELKGSMNVQKKDIKGFFFEKFYKNYVFFNLRWFE